MQKCHDLRTWMRFGDFGNHVGVDEKAHGCVSRASSFDRSRSRPTPLSGEARRSREPEPAVFLSHSSMETRTAVDRPFLVMTCGPSRRAFSTTSESRALAF